MSRTPASYSMTVVRGSTWEDEFTYTDASGTPIDLTGYQARMQVRTLDGQFGTTGAETLVMELSTDADNNRLTIEPLAGRVRLRVHASETALLNADNAKKVKHAYSLELYKPTSADPEYVIPLVQGSVTVAGEVTR